MKRKAQFSADSRVTDGAEACGVSAEAKFEKAESKFEKRNSKSESPPFAQGANDEDS
jgi:hypothetical protein